MFCHNCNYFVISNWRHLIRCALYTVFLYLCDDMVFYLFYFFLLFLRWFFSSFFFHMNFFRFFSAFFHICTTFCVFAVTEQLIQLNKWRKKKNNKHWFQKSDGWWLSLKTSIFYLFFFLIFLRKNFTSFDYTPARVKTLRSNRSTRSLHNWITKPFSCCFGKFATFD